MNWIKQNIFLIILLTIASSVVAQQNDLLAFNYQNQFIFNPSVTAQFGSRALTLAYEKDFTGIEGSPTVINIGYQSDLFRESNHKFHRKFGVGLALNQESAGLLRQSMAMGSLSYKQRLSSRNDYISLGFSVSGTLLGINENDVRAVHQNDPNTIFSNNNSLGLSAGIGLFYSSSSKSVYDRNTSATPIYQIGISTTRMIPRDYDMDEISIDEIAVYHAIGRAFFPIQGESYIAPMVELIYESSDAYNLRFTGLFDLSNKFNIGLSVDKLYNLGVQLGVGINENLKILAHGTLPSGELDQLVKSGYGANLVYTFPQ